MTGPTYKQARILIVDDIPENLEIAGRILENSDYDVHIADSGEKALSLLEHVDFDLILLDIMMPGIDGFETCRRIKAREEFHRIPIIYLSAKVDIESVTRGFQCGAADYIRKPFNAMELLGRIRTHIDLKKTIEHLETITTIDYTTRLSNHKDMLEKITYETYRYERNHSPFALILCQIVNYAILKEHYSAPCQQQVLSEISTLLQSNIRKSDLPSRWRADAFMILFPDTGIQTAQLIAEKLDRRFNRQRFSCPEGEFSLKMRYGIAVYTPNMSVEDLIGQAEKLTV
ncbi:MAG: hypothetical protein AVO33_11160 [delta proteobacterium ML8_F1]|nr:MAG: hypothetical protein AVO33_11160 [delta proteobacterium ML8_F1]